MVCRLGPAPPIGVGTRRAATERVCESALYRRELCRAILALHLQTLSLQTLVSIFFEKVRRLYARARAVSVAEHRHNKKLAWNKSAIRSHKIFFLRRLCGAAFLRGSGDLRAHRSRRVVDGRRSKDIVCVQYAAARRAAAIIHVLFSFL